MTTRGIFVRTMNLTVPLALAGLAVACAAVPDDRSPASEEPHPELGRVAWGRNLEDALQASAQTSRPVLLLFQEIPG